MPPAACPPMASSVTAGFPATPVTAPVHFHMIAVAVHLLWPAVLLKQPCAGRIVALMGVSYKCLEGTIGGAMRNHLPVRRNTHG